MLVCIYGMFIMPYKNKHLPNIIYIFLHLFCIIEHKRRQILYTRKNNSHASTFILNRLFRKNN
ncbi:hypothetical protein PFMALIP_03461 [Plasmodium falciparum MaliPS096_E11]|uniref:Uncharacterized protein n=1 Tax=Plasmodium falciparum MaliPS096_E11 TaxID=1036727 RepID=A0A024WMU6_PLAFA|nr:hypothetical protein PFMALIP_03461 [Plasmodium falciparum MaliPS096_E11]